MSDAPAVKADARVVSIARLKDNQIVGTADMRKLVGDLTPILQKTVPAFLKNAVDRVGSSLVVEMGRNPYVANCTALSLLGGLVQCAQLGLELGGILGQAYLVPYRNKGVYEAQFQVGFKGLIALAHRAGATKAFDAQPVFENDKFSIEKGTQPRVHHEPSLTGMPGELVGVYSYAVTNSGEVLVEYMSRAELESHRNRYSKAKGDSSPWQTAFTEMARKTVLRRLAKRIPMSAEMTMAASLDEYADEDVRQNLAALVTASVDRDPQPSPKATEVMDAIGSGPEPEAEDPSGVPR